MGGHHIGGQADRCSRKSIEKDDTANTFCSLVFILNFPWPENAVNLVLRRIIKPLLGPTPDQALDRRAG